jgi:hypothetical protein
MHGLITQCLTRMHPIPQAAGCSSKPHPLTQALGRLPGKSQGVGVGGSLHFEVVALLAHLFESVQEYLCQVSSSSETEVYRSLHTLSILMDRATFQAGYSKGGEGGMSRAMQFVTYMTRHFEELRTWRVYRCVPHLTEPLERDSHAMSVTDPPVRRSPFALQYIICICTHCLPVCLIPLWRYYAEQQPGAFSLTPAYVSSVLFSVLLMTLYNVYRDLEDPFDGEGWDDLKPDMVQGWVREACLKPYSFGEMRAIHEKLLVQDCMV